MKLVLGLVLAYLMGSIPSGFWIGKVFFHKNIHDYGSGNTGTTNTFRTLGIPAGIIVFLLDLLKGTVAVLLPLSFMLDIKGVSPLIFGFLAVLGHTFSIFDSFRGGKAVATSAGIILGYNPSFLLFLLLVFLLILVLFSMISLSSIAAALAAILGVAIFPAIHFILPSYDCLFTLIVCIIAGIILLRHRSNMQRIRKHEENLVPFGLNLSRQRKAEK